MTVRKKYILLHHYEQELEMWKREAEDTYKEILEAIPDELYGRLAKLSTTISDLERKRLVSEDHNQKFMGSMEESKTLRTICDSLCLGPIYLEMTKGELI